MKITMQALPNELILHVIRCLIPSSPPVVFKPQHPVTKSLLNLTLVSHITSGAAKHLLLRHCLYLDSEERLAKLMSLRQQSSVDLNAAGPEGLFLAPFPAQNLNCPSIVHNVSLLLSDISGTLARLVINLPLRFLYPEEDKNLLRPILREAFSHLTALEEFCSMQDELYLDTALERRGPQPEVWQAWPRLRYLALYNPCVDSARFVAGIKCCSNLTHLVLTRPDGIFNDVADDQDGLGPLPRLEQVIIVNTERGFSRDRRFHDDEGTAPDDTLLRGLKSGWLSNNQVGRASAEMSESDYFCVAAEVPIPPDLVGEDDSDILACQGWVGSRALSGTLWDESGAPFLDWPES
ncbi:hypothetical protein BDDG_08621 [Blastomyces dermatitidis ATCC 18188]|uniref:F-box domain-containing protein n=1 Tax=Ajellomyces dermatitidis (strain ATCC 18188 / CBS 674.68) TaxID=653446 RepID=F2TR13_AJEDA|nr:hypothetical protein BDDG_08621 [Blastomyces dermatitidis ATCC 18188]